MDMERYLTLSSWLSQNGISVSPPHEPRRSTVAQYGAMNPFDDVYSALEALEKAVEGDIAQLDATRPAELSTTAIEVMHQSLVVCLTSAHFYLIAHYTATSFQDRFTLAL